MSPGVYTQVRDLSKSRKRSAYVIDITPPPAPPAPPTSSIITEDLLIYLDAADVSSYPGTGTTWYDISGNNNNFTLSGSTYSSADGGVMTFDGTDDYVGINSLNLQRNFSLEVWVKFNTKELYKGGLFGQGGLFPNTSIAIWQDVAEGTLSYRMYANDLNQPIQFSTGSWYHYVFTYNHSSPYTKQIYRNGVLVGQSGTLSQYAGTGVFRIGQTYSPENLAIADPLSGSIGVVRAYSKILSAAEVLQNYRAQKSRYISPPTVGTPNLLYLDASNTTSYPGSGTTWFDLSGTGNDIILLNGPTFSTEVGGSFVFDGSNDSASTGSFKNPPTNTVTLATWIKALDGTRDAVPISLGRDVGGGGGGGVLLLGYGFGNPINVLTEFGSGVGRANVGNVLVNNTWNHIAMTAAGAPGEVRLYLNGEWMAVGSLSLGQGITSNPGISVGSLVDGSGNPSALFHSGSIATVSVYNSALTEAEILQMFNSERDRYGV